MTTALYSAERSEKTDGHFGAACVIESEISVPRRTRGVVFFCSVSVRFSFGTAKRSTL